MSEAAVIRPIRTVYRGYRFRSRLEARWAVFYDTLGVPWEYEREGYELPGDAWYLPDFWLPEQRYWIEIKGQEPTEIEERMLRDVVVATEANAGFIFWGDIPWPYPSDLQSESACLIANGTWDSQYWWCMCHECRRFEVQFNGRSDRMSCKRGRGGDCARSHPEGDRGHSDDATRLKAAYTRARSARFEHCE